MEIPPDLSEQFTLAPVRSGAVAQPRVHGQRPDLNVWLQPMLRVLPMGWSWATYFCQGVLEAAVEQCGVPRGLLVRDRRVSQPLGAQPQVAAYLDNFA
eukprot:2885355-Lingulodinium_polyedra.AAC.1